MKIQFDFKKVENNYVTIKHHSTSSAIEITVNKSTEDESLEESIWLDYYEMDALIKLINQINKTKDFYDGLDTAIDAVIKITGEYMSFQMVQDDHPIRILLKQLIERFKQLKK